MKALLYLVIIIGTFCLASCNRAPQANVLTISAADSLVAKWDKAWNDKNADDVMKLIANDASLVVNKKVISGHDSIQKLFVKDNIGFVRNLKISKVTCRVQKKYTWYCGTFSHVVVRHNGLIGNEKGNIIFTWKPQPDNTWKLSFISIE